MKQVIDTLAKLFQQYPNYPIVVAYSGGVDSQVLLNLILNTKPHWQDRDLAVCHVHHGLSEHADHWLAFAEQTCKKHNVNFIGKKVSLDLNSGESIEAQARELRYKALSEVYNQTSLILTGHHLNDQAETFLLALKRGAGVKGLSAMGEISKAGKDLLCRPLLSVKREVIEAYANQQQLAWVEDDSNKDERYDRNFVRNSVLPIIEQRWPSFSQTVARSAELCAENQLLVEELAAQDLAETICEQQQALDIEKLTQLSTPRLNNLIRYYLAKLDETMPSQAQLQELSQQLSVSQDKVPEVKLGNIVARRFQQKLYFTPVYQDITNIELNVDLSKLAEHKVAVKLPDKLGLLEFAASQFNTTDGVSVFSVDTLNKLTVKFSHENPKVQPDYRQHSRALKKVLQELKLAPWLRKRLPFVFQQEQLIMIPEHFVCKPFMADAQPFNIFVRWRAR